MSGVHHASVFQYQEYQKEIYWLIEQLDQQNDEPLRKRTCGAIQRLREKWPLRDLGEVKNGKDVLTQEWPLYEHGESGLITEDQIRSQSNPSSRDLGYWFLIVLAEYLAPCPSPLANWSVLASALKFLGWKQNDIDLLFKGLPTWQLLKPGDIEVSERLTNSSPYWLWLKPDWAKSGWLQTEEISRLYSQLERLESDIKAFNIRQIPNIDVDNPVVVRDYNEYLLAAYRDTLSMLLVAKEANQGLFMSITTYA